jgi:methionine synthase II (cobalamin-independent)
VETTVLGYPRIGARRELEKATEAFLAGRETRVSLTDTAAALRRETWETLRDAGLSGIPSNTFSLYDHVLDTAVMFNAVPERFAALDGLNAYFAMARGAEGMAPLERTKWFDTNYQYLVPELGRETDLRLAEYKPVLEYLQARSYGIETRPVLLGPLSFLLLSKPADPGFRPLVLLDRLLDVYEQLLEKLHASGADWVQLDEPVLAADRTGEELEALRHAYKRLGTRLRRPCLLLSTYFGEIGNALPVLAASPVEAIGLDFVAGPGNREALAAIGGIGIKTLFAGVIDGRHVWRADLPLALSLCASLSGLAGNLVVSTSCSLLHVPLDVSAETSLSPELAGRMAFARQKVDEVVALGRALSENDAVLAQPVMAAPSPVGNGLFRVCVGSMNTRGCSGSFSDSLRSTSSARSSVSSAPSSSLSATRAATMRLSGPMCIVSNSSSSSTPGLDSISSRITRCISGLAARPMRRSLLSMPSLMATTTSSTPIAMDAPPSHTGEPVSWRSPTPRPASTRPTMATLSSNRATLTVMSGLDSTWSSISLLPRRASPRTCQKARAKDVPSATNAMARAA